MEYVNPIIEQRIVTDVDALKYKTIQNYMYFLKCLRAGHKIKYQNILDKISLIDIYSELDKKAIYYKEFQLNGVIY